MKLAKKNKCLRSFLVYFSHIWTQFMSSIAVFSKTSNNVWQLGKLNFPSKYFSGNVPLYTKIHFYYREGRGNAHLTGNYKRIGDVVLHNFDSVTTEYYMRYVDTHGLILEKLERVLSDPNASQGHFRFAQVFRDFESQKVCYLPITTLILKPLHRILHYEILLERKCIFFFFFQK